MTQAPRTALITGASSGFGLLTAVTLARRGWRVLATMRDLGRQDRLEAAAREAGVRERIEFHELEVSNSDRIRALGDLVQSRQEPLHALVNNAGFAMPGFTEDVSDAELRRQFDTNFFGAAAVTRAFLPIFRRQGYGHVVMVSSVGGRMGVPGLGSYNASKFALEGWSEALRLEMKPVGIQVVLVEPGSFETNIWNAQPSSGMLDPKSPNAARTTRWRDRMLSDVKRADPRAVAELIADILHNPRPRLRYVIGKDARLGLLMRRLLPASLFELAIIKGTGADR
ncbi:MAG TPA: SDR family NAD(P)-dependent oxidoreductase [Terracidiphilus sp.]|nr:SDR family NAD(P)-dependent oxidoreductase [Terracidiphilus sp.]